MEENVTRFKMIPLVDKDIKADLMPKRRGDLFRPLICQSYSFFLPLMMTVLSLLGLFFFNWTKRTELTSQISLVAGGQNPYNLSKKASVGWQL